MEKISYKKYRIKIIVNVHACLVNIFKLDQTEHLAENFYSHVLYLLSHYQNATSGISKILDINFHIRFSLSLTNKLHSSFSMHFDHDVAWHFAHSAYARTTNHVQITCRGEFRIFFRISVTRENRYAIAANCMRASPTNVQLQLSGPRLLFNAQFQPRLHGDLSRGNKLLGAQRLGRSGRHTRLTHFVPRPDIDRSPVALSPVPTCRWKIDVAIPPRSMNNFITFSRLRVL